MLRLFILMFVFLGSFLHAHEGVDVHMHFLSTLHTQDFLVIVGVIIVALFIHKNYKLSN